MNLKEWRIQYDKTIKILDSLDLPQPEQGEDLYDYRDRIEEQFKNIELPPEMQGELFNVMSANEFGIYLHKRYGWIINESITYHKKVRNIFIIIYQ